MLNQPDLFAATATELSPVLRQDFILLDLETTGASPARDRIIEIGLIHCRQLEVIDTWSTLVNPGVGLTAFISDYTGISDTMLATAPGFAEVADTLRGYLQRGLLVAHNARFDYGFLQHEFSRAGQPYRAASLCTVQLSRKLFPAEKRHNLDALISRHGLRCDSRHRALGDAQVLVDFLRDLPNHCSARTLEQAFADLV